MTGGETGADWKLPQGFRVGPLTSVPEGKTWIVVDSLEDEHVTDSGTLHMNVRKEPDAVAVIAGDKALQITSSGQTIFLRLVEEPGFSTDVAAEVEPEKKPLTVSVLSATGLRGANGSGSGSDPYCTVEIQNGSSVLAQTTVKVNTNNPEWNEDLALADYVVGQSIVFHVWAKHPGKQDDFLGTAEVSSNQFFPGGSGVLDLKLADTCTGADALLKVKIIAQDEIQSELEKPSDDAIQNATEEANCLEEQYRLAVAKHTGIPISDKDRLPVIASRNQAPPIESGDADLDDEVKRKAVQLALAAFDDMNAGSDAREHHATEFRALGARGAAALATVAACSEDAAHRRAAVQALGFCGLFAIPHADALCSLLDDGLTQSNAREAIDRLSREFAQVFQLPPSRQVTSSRSSTKEAFTDKLQRQITPKRDSEEKDPFVSKQVLTFLRQVNQKMPGYLTEVLAAADLTPHELRTAGFDILEINGLGITGRQLKLAGFNPGDFKRAGFPVTNIKELGFKAGDFLSSGFAKREMEQMGYTIADLKDECFPEGFLKFAGYTAKDLKQADWRGNDIKYAGFGAKDMLGVGFEISDLVEVGFVKKDFEIDGVLSYAAFQQEGVSLEKLRKAGFSSRDLSTAGLWTVRDLNAAGYSYRELKDAGYSVADLLFAGCSSEDLKQLGYTAKALRDAGVDAEPGDSTELRTGRKSTKPPDEGERERKSLRNQTGSGKTAQTPRSPGGSVQRDTSPGSPTNGSESESLKLTRLASAPAAPVATTAVNAEEQNDNADGQKKERRRMSGLDAAVKFITPTDDRRGSVPTKFRASRFSTTAADGSRRRSGL